MEISLATNEELLPPATAPAYSFSYKKRIPIRGQDNIIARGVLSKGHSTDIKTLL